MTSAPAGTTRPEAVSQDTPVLRITDLRVGYRTAAGTRTAVDGLDLTAAPGRITAVVGESGSGKSTTAHAVIGLLPPGGRVEHGSVRLEGEELTGLSERAWRDVRGRRIGFVPQDPGVSLDPVKPVGRQVAEVLRVHHLATGRGAAQRAVDLLAAAGLPDPARRSRQYPHELSGGMRQRVLIAMATAARPRLLVADEPTSALDVTVQRQILDHLEALAADTGTAVLLITHDLGVVADRAQHVVVMSRARVVEAGPTREVLADPRHPYTRRLLADVPRLTPRARPATPPAPPAEATSLPRPSPGPAPGSRPAPLSGSAPPVPGPGPASAAGPSGDAPDPGVLLRVRGLTLSFPLRGPGPRRRHLAVDGVGFDIPRGRTLGLVGESGSGKSTTARLVLGLERPEAGTVELDGVDVTAVRGAARRRLHRRVQLVHQNPYASLNPRFTVEELLTEPLRNHRVGDRAQRAATVRRLLDDVALPADVLRRRAAELSGGQRQRVAIARALALGPDLLVCDEPVSALDVTVQARILELLLGLQERHGMAYLFISHDLAVVGQVSDRVAVLRAGHVVEEGATDQVLRTPRHPYTRELLAAVPGRRNPHTPHDPDTPDVPEEEPGETPGEAAARTPHRHDRPTEDTPWS
ncbi:ABC transporter ATP-binding protein [Streptomyces argyrophyllae]|uniref:ABC transporter ATP-binding protein n=1 Tax=Streptomyces argyrophylli TaxID=2726118 RepID=A0A6M4PRU1_9ACTN|nr:MULTISPECIES: ABC transporter ATP-binding protein [Streptomyces]QJS13918.1 ABC transporter ATP-binding protein [Streptomyces argyrophyllae]